MDSRQRLRVAIETLTEKQAEKFIKLIEAVERIEIQEQKKVKT